MWKMYLSRREQHIGLEANPAKVEIPRTPDLVEMAVRTETLRQLSRVATGAAEINWSS